MPSGGGVGGGIWLKIKGDVHFWTAVGEKWRKLVEWYFVYTQACLHVMVSSIRIFLAILICVPINVYNVRHHAHCSFTSMGIQHDLVLVKFQIKIKVEKLNCFTCITIQIGPYSKIPTNLCPDDMIKAELIHFLRRSMT